MRTAHVAVVLLLAVLLLGASALSGTYSDAEIEQVAAEVLSDFFLANLKSYDPSRSSPSSGKIKSASPKTKKTRKTVALADADTEAAGHISVTIDKQSNEHWIQLRVSPAKKVYSAQVRLQNTGQIFAASSPNWDHGNGANFVGKPGDKIPYGTKVTIHFFLRNGGEASIPNMTWKKGSKGSTNGSTSTPKPSGGKGGKGKGGKGKGGKSGSGSSSSGSFWTKPSAKSALVQNAIRKIRAFKRSGSGPRAKLTGEDSTRKRNKNALNNACNELKINDLKARAMIFALFTLESEQMYSSSGEAQRDTSKDGKWLWKNYSPLNMNVDMLQKIGIPKSKFESLNKLRNIKETLKVLLIAMKKLGLEGFLNFHRGGDSGYKRPNDPKYKIPVFKDGVYNIMQKYIQDTSLFTNGKKVWANIPHV